MPRRRWPSATSPASASPPPAWSPALATSPRRTSRAAPSSAGRWPSSRRSRCRSRTSTSPRAPSTSRPRTSAWRLDQGLDVSDDLAVAAYWTCTEGPPALRTCHHLHGGMGVDETYPLHHYFSWVTDLTHLLDVRAEAVPVEDPTTKNLELSQAQRAFKAEMREYFSGLAGHNEHREMGLRPARRRLPARGPADGRGRLDGRRLAEGVRRPRARRDRADDLRQRGAVRRRAPARRHPADRRPDADQVRQREAEGPVPQADPRRRRALRDRLLRAGRRHRPGLAAHLGQEGRRPLRRQRPEAVDHRRPPGRLRLARGPHRPGRAQAQGHLDPHRRHQATPATHTRRSSPPTARTTSTRPTTTTSASPSTCWSARRTRAGS